jgi:hypothetical protein
LRESNHGSVSNRKTSTRLFASYGQNCDG